MMIFQFVILAFIFYEHIFISHISCMPIEHGDPCIMSINKYSQYKVKISLFEDIYKYNLNNFQRRISIR